MKINEIIEEFKTQLNSIKGNVDFAVETNKTTIDKEITEFSIKITKV